MEKVFPNGFSSWQETHFEIVQAITRGIDSVAESEVLKRVRNESGTGGFYELAENLTDKFEKLHEGREWDGEFFDELELFIDSELK